MLLYVFCIVAIYWIFHKSYWLKKYKNEWIITIQISLHVCTMQQKLMQSICMLNTCKIFLRATLRLRSSTVSMCRSTCCCEITGIRTDFIRLNTWRLLFCGSYIIHSTDALNTCNNNINVLVFNHEKTYATVNSFSLYKIKQTNSRKILHFRSHILQECQDFQDINYVTEVNRRELFSTEL